MLASKQNQEWKNKNPQGNLIVWDFYVEINKGISESGYS